MRPYKATLFPPFHQVRWHGLYYRDGHWQEVRDGDGKVVVFTTSKAAIASAKEKAYADET